MPQTTSQPYIFKTKPFAHQLEAFNISKDREAYALLFEMGAGKSKPTVDTAAYLYSCGRINSVLLVAPNGVHSKWLREDFPLSIPDHIEYHGAVWEAGNKKAERACEDLFKPGPHLRVLCMNVEAFSTKRGAEFAKSFLLATDCMMVVDESSRIKNPSAKRTETICKLGDKAKYRRILSGTAVTNSPFDLYGQFMFLDTSILGQSYYAFKAEYAEMLPKDSPLVQGIMRKNNLRFAPQMEAKDETGKVKYKNLEKLKALIAPHSMRVEKKDVLDLPEKLYQTRYFKLPASHMKAYVQLRDKLKLDFGGGEKTTIMHKLTLLLRLQQLTSGYLPTDSGAMARLYPDPKDNPRVELLLDTLEDLNGQTIIWCRFIEEIELIGKLLGNDAVLYYGAVSNDMRKEAVDMFQAGTKKYFVGNAATGGIGLNLTAAQNVIYYSNTFSYEDRKQSEDRAHRIGQRNDVNYFDFVAEETVDSIIIRALRNKGDVADFMMDFEKEILK